MSMVRFGDVAERVNTKEDRFNTDLVYYVGGDHIETNELKVSGRGIIKEADLGPMFYFGFKPGDILFVTRNPHLRKSAKVDFAGICSEKTLVIATKDENVLLQDYLAGVMQSDDFWDFMEENKSGSVNYFINWSTLADYEFDLPPIEKQRELAELLWAANDLKESYKKLIVATDEMLKAKFREMFATGCLNGCVRDLVDRNVQMVKAKYSASDVFSYIDISSVAGCFEGITTCNEFMRSNAPSRAQQCVRRGDVVYSTVRPNLRKMAVVEFDDDNHVASTGFCVLRAKDENSVGYLKGLLSSDEFVAAMMDKASGTTYPAVRDSDVLEYKIPLPPLALQREFVEIARKADETKAALKKSIADVESVIKGVVNG